MKRVVILISGRGSNMLRLLEQAESFHCVAVIADKPCPGVTVAAELGVQTHLFLREGSGATAKEAQQRKIAQHIESLDADWIVLAGFMQILDPWFVKQFSGRVVNIHPSLLPAFPGLNTHKRVLEHCRDTGFRDKFHGCSVHLVDEGVDTGPLLAQAQLSVMETDTEDSLAARVLTLEHGLYPWVLNSLGSGDIQLGPLRYSDRARRTAKQAGFVLPPPPN